MIRYMIRTTATALAAACLLSGSNLLAGTITLTADADTYSRPNVNAGAAALLDIRDFATPDFIGYLRFDLSSVPDQITGAKLTLHKVPGGARNDTITTGRFANYGLLNLAGNTPQNWDELTVADTGLGAEYNAAGGDPVIAAQVMSLDADAGANVIETVDNNVTPQMLEGADLVSFLEMRRTDDGLATVISAILTQNRGWAWASRDNTDMTVWPTLEVTYVPEPASLSLCGLALAGLMAFRRK